MNDVTKVSSLRGNSKAIDPDVKVPAAVRRAAEAAEAAQKAAYPDQTPPSDTPPTPANSDTITIAQDPPPPQEPQVTPKGNEQPPTPQPQQPTPPAEPKSWSPEVETELHRIRSVEGRKRAALEQQVLLAADRIAILESNLQELQNQSRAPAPAPVAHTKLVTEQEESEFGHEMLDVMGRRAKETISPELATLRAEMAALQQKVEGTTTAVTANARTNMLKSLDQDLPDWRKINMMNEFKAWLALPDPFFGVSRFSALTKAFENNETTRVLNIFRGFVSELAAQDPDYGKTEDAQPAPQPAKPSLETMAAPGRARTSAQPNAPAEKQIITTADVEHFYAAVRKGMYVGREAEKKALEEELFAAQREGRVRAV